MEQLRTAGIKIQAQWIPSDIGISGNEIGDDHANRGRREPQPEKTATSSLENATRRDDVNVPSKLRKFALGAGKLQDMFRVPLSKSKCTATKRQGFITMKGGNC